MNPKRIAFHHFGCKVNFAEASSLSRQFADKGYQLMPFHDKADIYVISSCVVTASAEKKCRAAIRQAHTLNPDARIAVIGCFPQLKPEELAAMEGVDIVLGHEGKFNLLEEIEVQGSEVKGQGTIIRHLASGIRHPASGIRHSASVIRHPASEFVPSYSVGDRTRSFLKIQDGCDYHCAYCAIPLARGKSRSDSIAHVIREAGEIAGSGVKEIVLTGVNIGHFGRHQNESLFQLLEAIEAEIEIPRVRISSIEPDLLEDDIIRLISSSKKFLPHFHIPLQSGSDKILRAMKRKYTTELYSDRVNTILGYMPDACIAADVIVGFPGETDADFRETHLYLERLPISYMHVFSYSRREHTLASKSPEFVPGKVIKERSDLLHKLSDEKKLAFYRRNKNRVSRVLFESDNKEGMMHGFTENYIKVKTPFDEQLINEIREVRLEEMEQEMCYLVKW